LSQWGDSRKPEKFSRVFEQVPVVIDDSAPRLTALFREKLNCVFSGVDYTVGRKIETIAMATL